MNKQGNTHDLSTPTCIGKANCTDCDLRQMVLFAGLTDPELRAILQPVDVIRTEPQDRLYQEGAAGAYAYTLRNGVIKLVKALPNGDTRIVRLMTKGDTIGLEVLLNEPYHHTAVALSSTEMCRIPIAVLNQLDERSHTFHHQLLARWQKSIDAAEQFITDLATGQARTRLAHLLLNYFSDGLAEVWNSPARDDIAHMLGITVETTSRLMAEFKRDGLIREENGHIALLDPVALKTIAEG